MIVYVVLAPTISGDGWFLYSIHTSERKAQDVINEQCGRFDYGRMRIDKREVS